LHLIALGGLGEIGKNMMAVEYSGDIMVIDCGLAFPEEEMLGVDLVLPDITYLLENKSRVRGIVLTHGHEDHIGALPYVLRELDVPVYGTKLTLGLVQGKLTEHGMSLRKGKLVRPGDSIRVGPFQVEFFRVNHSIPDPVGFAIRTPVGTVVHTGDFKFDHTPVDGEVTQFHKLAELGDEGVLALLSDSTNAERPGYTMSERTVGDTLDEVIATAKGRVIIASFASNVHRLQQAIISASRHGRKVAVVGRSMENVTGVAAELGYLRSPNGTLVEVEELNRFPANRQVILTTGSQGEPMSALTRMAAAEHRRVEIIPGDTVIIAANPIPGNEKLVARTVDNLFRRGADVVYERVSGVHVSGHASQEELKLMLNLIRPRFFVPVHGEYRHLIRHAQLATSLGIPRQNVLVGENGTIFEFTANSGTMAGKVTAGQVMVDGLGVGDVGNIVLRDRKLLAEDGVIIVVLAMGKQSKQLLSGPDLVSRGFVYVREAEKLMDEAKGKVREAVDKCVERKVTDWTSIKGVVRDSLSKFVYDRTKRRPMILPIIMEI
jgi:ribonuclease J